MQDTGAKGVMHIGKFQGEFTLGLSSIPISLYSGGASTKGNKVNIHINFAILRVQ